MTYKCITDQDRNPIGMESLAYSHHVKMEGRVLDADVICDANLPGYIEPPCSVLLLSYHPVLLDFTHSLLTALSSILSCTCSLFQLLLGLKIVLVEFLQCRDVEYCPPSASVPFSTLGLTRFTARKGDR